MKFPDDTKGLIDPNLPITDTVATSDVTFVKAVLTNTEKTKELSGVVACNG